MYVRLKTLLLIGPVVAVAAVGPHGGAGRQKAPAMRPICDMTAQDRYKGEDGGLYGMGRNSPPEEQRNAAMAAVTKIQPLDSQGTPSKDGKVVLVSISMSNATQEFSYFKVIADNDQGKSPSVTIVDCAQGGQAMAEWVDPAAPTWSEAERRLARAGVTDSQVQSAWIKLANKRPTGDLQDHGRKLESDTLAVVRNAKAKFPNLRIAYLSSRIYGGYSNGPLNPEPYAYESGFVARWLVQDQIAGEKGLNCDPKKGDVVAPVLVWGPYLWADGTIPRERRACLEEGRPWARRNASEPVWESQSRADAPRVLQERRTC
jgi:hypothetical protein